MRELPALIPACLCIVLLPVSTPGGVLSNSSSEDAAPGAVVKGSRYKKTNGQLLAAAKPATLRRLSSHAPSLLAAVAGGDVANSKLAMKTTKQLIAILFDPLDAPKACILVNVYFSNLLALSALMKLCCCLALAQHNCG